MADVINFDHARRRKGGASHPVVQALDALALALADHKHEWTEEEARLYETAIARFEE